MLIDKISICNMALRNLGQPPIQSIDQRGVSAEAARLSYDEARLEALSGVLWGFAKSWVSGVAVAIDPEPQYSYVFAYPADALQVFYIDHPPETDAPDYSVADRPDGLGKIISTNEAAPIFIFTRDIENTARFDQQFVQALAALLASKMAMPITKSEKLEAKWFQRWIGMRDVAEARTKNEGSRKDDRLGFYHEVR